MQWINGDCSSHPPGSSGLFGDSYQWEEQKVEEGGNHPVEVFGTQREEVRRHRIEDQEWRLRKDSVSLQVVEQMHVPEWLVPCEQGFGHPHQMVSVLLCWLNFEIREDV